MQSIRRQFPILSRKVNGHPLVYLDTAATSQKPDSVLRAMTSFYCTANANAHRGMHPLAEEATKHYEHARGAVQNFLCARSAPEIVFTKSCTEAINLVAKTFVTPNDHILLSIYEHHSNIIPWMQTGATLHWHNLHDFEDMLSAYPITLVAITGQSNVTGRQPAVKTIVDTAHRVGAKVLVDAAQLVAHHPIDIQELDCDFLTFSGHKLYGPTGIGVLYAKEEWLEHMPPFLGGGGMVHSMSDQSFQSLPLPEKFEAGTPPVAEAVGLAAAIDWLTQFSWEDIETHEQALITHAEKLLSTIPNLNILDQSPRSGCLSFTLSDIHPHDLTELLGKEGYCLRAGHHCAQPLHRHFGVTASTRISFGIYNTTEETDLLPTVIESAKGKLLCIL
ncbi:cysteine desulfurase [Candidatus Peregrinibacteria bacterium CG22_combo_CG10-13_8_21_14_all_49_11]|nr:MAG: cysteine desulfurase [Candidatus Peregrinibacteria bacterium CG22_combo_CG10-13_8_21_14_all_49_11]